MTDAASSPDLPRWGRLARGAFRRIFAGWAVLVISAFLVGGAIRIGLLPAADAWPPVFAVVLRVVGRVVPALVVVSGLVWLAAEVVTGFRTPRRR